MAKKFVCLVTFLFSVMLALTANSQEKTKGITKVRGTVVAEEGFLLVGCYHVCELTLLVRLDESNQSDAKYVIVSVKYMDRYDLPQHGRPLELVKRARRWVFTAKLSDEKPILLQKFVEAHDQSGNSITEEWKLPAWKLLEGVADEQLPFGKPILSYEVEPGKYRLVK